MKLFCCTLFSLLITLHSSASKLHDDMKTSSSSSSSGSDRHLMMSANQVSGLKINGWWAGCSQQNQRCQGGFKSYESEDPIDITGATCYVNPIRKTQDVVQWVGPLANETDSENVYMYAVMFPTGMSDKYYPTNCTDGGACSCETIEPLRAGWDVNPSACGDGADAIACHIIPLSLEAGKDCNINSRILFKDPSDGDVTRSFCSWTVSLAGSSSSAAAGSRITTAAVMAITTATAWIIF